MSEEGLDLGGIVFAQRIETVVRGGGHGSLLGLGNRPFVGVASGGHAVQLRDQVVDRGVSRCRAVGCAVAIDVVASRVGIVIRIPGQRDTRVAHERTRSHVHVVTQHGLTEYASGIVNLVVAEGRDAVVVVAVGRQLAVRVARVQHGRIERWSGDFRGQNVLRRDDLQIARIQHCRKGGTLLELGVVRILAARAEGELKIVVQVGLVQRDA